MKNLLGALGILLALAGGLAVPGPAAAAPIDNACNTGWYVNEDEKDRKPTQVQGGLRFVGNDLVHHAASGTVADLKPDSFGYTLAAGSASPDQPSFFSVEVGAPTTYADYATLRWDTGENLWVMVRSGVAYKHADPAELIKMDPKGVRSSNILSFGVGYTDSPSSAVEVTVESVKFKGVTYSMACAPAPTPSASSSASSPASSGSASATPVAGGDVAGLPVTGPKLLATMGVGIGMVVAGALGIWASRRKRARFEAQ